MYNKKTHIHFIGISGIGMSGIATILKQQGYDISGCDLDADHKNTLMLKDLGCKIYVGNNTPACQDASIDILVYSSAVKADNPEITAAQQRGIPTIPRALMLAELMRTKFSIAIAGAHGKTTTTSLISHVLIEAHQDPTVIIGGHLKNISHNARFGAGQFLVAEADESDRSFLRLYPTIAVVTNINLEHVDVYKDINDVKETFKQFLSNIPFYGKAFVCSDNEHIQSILPLPHIKTVKFGITDTEADYRALNIQLFPAMVAYDVWSKKEARILTHIQLPMPGIHNVLNSLAATAVALDLGITPEQISASFPLFKGVDRRFTFKGIFKGAEVFDDYGHHPHEIHHTLLVARERAKNGLTVMFQPHRYTRTKGLWNDFLALFIHHAPSIKNLVITDIYAASEQPLEGITSERFVRELQKICPTLNVHYVPMDNHMKELQNIAEKIAEEGQLILLQGAGKMNKLPEVLCINERTEA